MNLKFFLIAFLFLISCGSEDDGNAPLTDTAPPIITLIGETNMIITLETEFIDPGSSALDDTDGDITSNIQVTGYVDTSVVGDYVLTYSVSDLAGNTASAERIVSVVDVLLPQPINRELHFVENAWGAALQKYFDFETPFYSQVQFNYSTGQNNVWSDLVKMNFDGSYEALNLTETVFGTAQDSLNGLLFDVDLSREKLLVNFWGEGELGSWYYPNVLVIFDLDGNNYQIMYDARGTNDSTFYTNVLFDLNNDGAPDIYLGDSGYIINEPNPIRVDTEEGPGPVFRFDFDSDQIDDLIHFDTEHNTWIMYKGGAVFNKSIISSDYVFRNYIDDYLSIDYDADGDMDLVLLDALTDGTNDGCDLCTGKISVLENINGGFIDVTETIFDDSTYPQLFGDNNILAHDYDNDWDMDLFFPDYYYHNAELMNDFYWENQAGNFVKHQRTDL